MEDNGETSLKVLSESDYDSDAQLITRRRENNATGDLSERRFSKSVVSFICPCTCVSTRRQYTPDPENAPQDRFHLLYLCFFLAGAGFLFPFNSFVSAIDYFYCLYKAQFSAVSELIPMTYLIVTLFTSTLNLLLVERLSPSLRITFGYVMFTVSLMFVPLLDIGIHNYTVSTGVSFYLTLASVLVVGLGSGFQQSSYYGLSSMLPPRYSQALLAGESVAGFVVAVNRIFTKLVFSERVGAMVFFAVSLLFVWLCVGCFIYIIRSPFVKYHVRKCREEKSKSKEHEMSESLGKLEDEENDAIEQERSDGHLLQVETQQSTLRQKIAGALRIRLVVVSQIWRLMVTIFTTYLITLLIFPGLISEIQYDVIGDWTPVILITLFNLGDFIAKCAALIKIRWNSTVLMLVGFLRLLLIPIAIMCVSPSPCDPVLAAGVMGWGVLLNVALGLSNGYFGSLPMINVSKEVKEEKDRELAGTIMIWTLLLGLSTGSVLAYAVTPLTKLDSSCTPNSTCLVDVGFNDTFR